MTQIETQMDARLRPISLDRAIAEYGAWRVIAAGLWALVRRRRSARYDPRRLTSHLRRDIGLPMTDHLPSSDAFRL